MRMSHKRNSRIHAIAKIRHMSVSFKTLTRRRSDWSAVKRNEMLSSQCILKQAYLHNYVYISDTFEVLAKEDFVINV